MEEETRYTKQDLETMRAWTLQRKIQVTQTRLIEWLGRYDWNVYVSFSGGKDSTVLADLAARVYQVFSCPKRQDPLRLVFVNTGLEYPEIQKFVRDFAEWLKAKYKIPVELEILHPSMTFPQVLSKYGYPVISKETAKVIYYARRGSRWAINRLDGLDKHGNESKFKERFKKYKFLIDAPFETSQLCCDVMKKGPAHIRNLEDQYYSTLGAVNSDGMPHGKGGVSNPVERVVLNIPQSVSDTIANMRRENEKLTAIKGEILSELNALNYREKAVIYGFYIDGLQWERLSQRVNYSPRQCRNIRNIALERLAKRFEQNKRISHYVFPEK